MLNYLRFESGNPAVRRRSLGGQEAVEERQGRQNYQGIRRGTVASFPLIQNNRCIPKLALLSELHIFYSDIQI